MCSILDRHHLTCHSGGAFLLPLKILIEDGVAMDMLSYPHSYALIFDSYYSTDNLGKVITWSVRFFNSHISLAQILIPAQKLLGFTSFSSLSLLSTSFLLFFFF